MKRAPVTLLLLAVSLGLAACGGSSRPRVVHGRRRRRVRRSSASSRISRSTRRME